MGAGAQYPGKDLEAMSFAVRYHRWIIDSFAPYLAGSVAEVGAGIGSVSRLILEKGVERLVAFEPSSNMFPLLREGLKDEPRAAAVNDFFGASQAGAGFDAVVYLNVLEHIAEDAAETRTAFSALRPGGHLLVFVPALAWLYGEPDRQVGHVRRYAKRGLEALVAAAGFQVVASRYFDLAGVLPWYVNFVLLKNTPTPGNVGLYDRLVVPLMRRVEAVVRPPLGKNVLLVARRP